MLSKLRTVVEHEIQREAGKTTDSFLGNLYIHTFAKLPITSPKINMAVAINE